MPMTNEQRAKALQEKYDAAFDAAEVGNRSVMDWPLECDIEPGEKRDADFDRVEREADLAVAEMKRCKTALDLADEAVENQHRVLGPDGKPLDNASKRKVDMKIDPGFSEKDIKRFRVGAYLNAATSKTKDFREAGFEAEAVKAMNDEIDKKGRDIGRSRRGDVLDHRFLMNHYQQKMQRQLSVALGGETGSNVVFEESRPEEFIDLLTNQMVTTQLGARVISGVVGNLVIPRQLTDATSEFVSEDGEDTETLLTLGNTAWLPHHLRTRQSWTRQLAIQSEPNIEGIVRNSLTRNMALTMDFKALHGDDSVNAAEPDGIANYTGVSTVVLGAPDGGAPTREALIEMEQNVATGNALTGNLAYVTNPGVRAFYKNLLVDAGSGKFVWENTDTPLNGYRALISNQVLANLTKGAGTDLSAMFFGNWEDLWYAMWDGLEVLVDPYTGASTSTTKIYYWQSMDWQLKHVESFTKIIDADLS